MSRTDNSLKNIKFALAFQAATTFMGFFSRKVFVQVLTEEYLGLNGTFSNVLSMLSLAELGVGTAITYSLYKPLADADQEKVAAIMALYRRVYWAIGVVVAALGSALMPFLPLLIRDMPDIPHIHLIYLLFVLNSALSYFYAYKQSLIIADQRQYIVTACQNGTNMLLTVLQMIFLWLTRNYFVYLGLQIGMTLLKNIILSRQADRLYPYLKTTPPKSLDDGTKREIIRNVKALFTHNLGGVVVFSTDNLLIVHFVGMAAVGLYSNYLLVVTSLTSVYTQLTRAVTASVGNLGASEEPEVALSVFWKLNFFFSWLYGFSAVCLAVLLTPFVTLWLGESYQISQGVVWLIALNFYVRGMRQAVLTFRSAYGLYWFDRHKPIAEGAVNLIASIILAIRFGTAGVLAGTVISTMTVCFWVEPMLLFKHAFHTSAKRFFRDYAVNTAVALVTLGVVWGVCALLPDAGMPAFIAKMAVCGTLGNAGFLIAYCRRDEFRFFVRLILDRCASALRAL